MRVNDVLFGRSQQRPNCPLPFGTLFLWRWGNAQCIGYHVCVVHLGRHRFRFGLSRQGSPAFGCALGTKDGGHLSGLGANLSDTIRTEPFGPESGESGGRCVLAHAESYLAVVGPVNGEEKLHPPEISLDTSACWT